MLNFITEKKSLWDRLKETSKPIVLYGMGDGAQKIIDKMNELNIPLADIFASDEFVRGHSFNGIRVKKYSEIESLYDDFFILIGFAVDYDSMLNRLFELDSRHETAAPDVPLFGDGVFDLDFVEKNKDKIEKVYSLLADEWSKKVYANIINYKISGKISYLKEISTDRVEDLKEIFEFTDNEDYLDLGAYDGDTIKEFSALTNGQFNSITALEPDEKNFRKLSLATESDPRITCIRKAVWNEETVLRFNNRAGRNSSLKDDGRVEVPATSIDSLSPDGFSFIKMDVEGAETQALLGGKRVITQCKPKLFISAYHRNEDIFELPLLLLSLRDDYKIFFRKHPYVPAWEINILAK